MSNASAVIDEILEQINNAVVGGFDTPLSLDAIGYIRDHVGPLVEENERLRNLINCPHNAADEFKAAGRLRDAADRLEYLEAENARLKRIEEAAKWLATMCPLPISTTGYVAQPHRKYHEFSDADLDALEVLRAALAKGEPK